MRVHIATDHAGLELSDHLVKHLTAKGYEMVNHGPKSYDPEDDYPAFCINAAKAVVEAQRAGVDALGIVLGGSGNGEQIAANKVEGIRAALAWNLDTAQVGSRTQQRERDCCRRAQHLYTEARADRSFPRRTIQRSRTPRTPYRQDRNLRDDWRGYRLAVPEGHSLHRLARQFRRCLRRASGCRYFSAGPVRFGRRADSMGTTLNMPSLRGRELFCRFSNDFVPAGASGALRRLQLWGRPLLYGCIIHWCSSENWRTGNFRPQPRARAIHWPA